MHTRIQIRLAWTMWDSDGSEGWSEVVRHQTREEPRDRSGQREDLDVLVPQEKGGRGIGHTGGRGREGDEG